jgi:hypothetical protein
LKIFVVIEDFEHSVDKFDVNVHGVLIEAVIEVFGEFLVLGFAIGGILEVVLEEGGLENVLGLYYVHGGCGFHLF